MNFNTSINHANYYQQSLLAICNHQVASSKPAVGTSNIKGLQRCKPFSFGRVSTNCQPCQRVQHLGFLKVSRAEVGIDHGGLQAGVAQHFLQRQDGFSRVNLFDALQKNVPAVHDLKIHQMKYASPGEITIDALESVGSSVKSTVIRYRKERTELASIVRSLNIMLSDKALKRLDLSKYTDLKLPLTQQDKDYITEKMESLAQLLAIENEFSDLSSKSPNIVVSAKVLLSVVSRVERMADFAASGLLDLERSPQPADTTG